MLAAQLPIILPDYQPSLLLDFALTKTLDPRITFTRASAGTYFGQDGLLKTAALNEARLDNNPATGESLGMLIEESRANILTYSEQINNAAWGKGDCTVSADAIIAPDGNLTADKLVENLDTNKPHQVSRGSIPAGTYRYSVYAKTAGRDITLVHYNPTDGEGGRSYFNLSTGAVTAGTGSIESVGNGWYRCSITFTNTVETSIYFGTVLAGTSTRIFNGDGTSGIYIWGAQLEVGAFPTSYIPTAIASVTRSSDVASITASAFSMFYRQDQGSVVVKVRPANIIGVRPILHFDDSTTNNCIAVRGNAGNAELYIRAGGVDQAQVVAGAVAAGTSYQLAASWRAGQCAVSLNGGAPVVGAPGTIPAVSRLLIGSDGANYNNGTIASVAYYQQYISPDRLSRLSA